MYYDFLNEILDEYGHRFYDRPRGAIFQCHNDIVIKESEEEILKRYKSKKKGKKNGRKKN